MNNLEIEKKFLVVSDEWKGKGKCEYVHQGYLNQSDKRTVRIRIKGNKAFFTVKGLSQDGVQAEYETEIPVSMVQAIFDDPQALCAGYPIEKQRTTLIVGDQTWEVDEFSGHNTGLVIAEAEYTGPLDGKSAWEKNLLDTKPEWVGEEVSTVWRYRNSRLSIHPYELWSEQQKNRHDNLEEDDLTRP